VATDPPWSYLLERPLSLQIRPLSSPSPAAMVAGVEGEGGPVAFS
jgi:hypothetical protein